MKRTVIAILFVLATLSIADASRVAAASFPATSIQDFWTDVKILKCLGDLTPAVGSCLAQFSQENCCKAFQQLNADCSPVGLGNFYDIFFQDAVKNCPKAPLP